MSRILKIIFKLQNYSITFFLIILFRFIILRSYSKSFNLTLFFFIAHPFLEGIEYHTIQVIKTEGIYSQWGELTVQEYEQDLKNLRTNLDKGTIDAYLKKRTKFIR